MPSQLDSFADAVSNVVGRVDAFCGRVDAMMRRRGDADWDENKHPRDGGQFAGGGSGGASKLPKGRAQRQESATAYAQRLGEGGRSLESHGITPPDKFKNKGERFAALAEGDLKSAEEARAKGHAGQAKRYEASAAKYKAKAAEFAASRQK